METKRTEYIEVLAFYKEYIKTLGQVTALLLTANLAVVGVAVERGTYELFLVGGLIMFVLFRACYRQAQIMIPVILRGLILEMQFGEEGLLHYKTSKLRASKKFKAILEEGSFYSLHDANRDITSELNKILKKFDYAIFRFDFPFNISRIVLVLILFAMFLQFAIFIYNFKWFLS